MTIIRNPFITSGYVSSDCLYSREKESETLIREVSNRNNLALISTRRMGKAGLIQYCFRERKIRRNYYTFFIDIYATKSLRDLVFVLSKETLEELKPSGKKALQLFWKSVKSLYTSVSFDINGTPSPSLGLGDIQAPAITLDEIFHYLNHADKPYLVATDEFQQIAGYAEDNVEATLYTYAQHRSNAHFIFIGSQRYIMENMSLTPSHPFYQSVSMMHLESIPLARYTAFTQLYFAQAGKSITDETVETIYRRFDGIIWYMQKVLHTLYDMTPAQRTYEVKMVEEAVHQIIDSFKFTYSEMLFRIPEKQKELLIAITKEGKAKAITPTAFIKKYKLSSPSSVQSALKGLLEEDFIT